MYIDGVLKLTRENELWR